MARRLGDETADDVVSETFLAAFRQRRACRTPPSRPSGPASPVVEETS
ncbi:hypothetical protein ACIBF7_33215 [Nonomuraea sp. NPDC050478]